ncbi:hypothetical protein Dda_6717 [Drechslerella dactyloides]|uniref:Uncharacterized protein n=1 Tax=Drechslerella dactyloides TaxID=74499 RepID=A0AAD6NHN3_DREDA|nr:hypothetical protein Dda_6717 [Drechslerella dactyloides]
MAAKLKLQLPEHFSNWRDRKPAPVAGGRESQRQNTMIGWFNRVPVDIICYIVEEFIQDRLSLAALSATNRAFRTFALPRLQSHTVILDVTDCLAGVVPDSASDTVLAFLSESGRLKPAQVRVLEIRNEYVPPGITQQPLSPTAEKFVQVLLPAFLQKCVGLRKVVRDGYEHHGLKTADLIMMVLPLPSLRILCLRIRESPWSDVKEMPVFEEYESSGILDVRQSDSPNGIVCLSISLPVDRQGPGWDETWRACRRIFILHTDSLKHLDADGPDLERIMQRAGRSSLEDMRLESLRFRMRFNAIGFRRALRINRRQGAISAGVGTTGNEPQRRSSFTVDALLGLRRLEFHGFQTDGRRGDTQEPALLNHLEAPNLKHLRLANTSPIRGNAVLYLRSFSGLESLELGTAVCFSYTSVFDTLQALKANHADSLRTLRVQEGYLYHRQIFELTEQQAFKVLRRLEINYNHTVNQPHFLVPADRIWRMMQQNRSIRELKLVLPHFATNPPTEHPNEPHNTCNPAPRHLIAAVYSTAFYIKNLFSELDTSHYPYHADEDTTTSTGMLTDFRQQLHDTRENQVDFEAAARLYLAIMHHRRTCDELSGEGFLEYLTTGELSYPDESVDGTLAFMALFTEFPSELELFQLVFIKDKSLDPFADRRACDEWRKLAGEWVYRANYC